MVEPGIVLAAADPQTRRAPRCATARAVTRWRPVSIQGGEEVVRRADRRVELAPCARMATIIDKLDDIAMRIDGGALHGCIARRP